MATPALSADAEFRTTIPGRLADVQAHRLSRVDIGSLSILGRLSEVTQSRKARKEKWGAGKFLPDAVTDETFCNYNCSPDCLNLDRARSIFFPTEWRQAPSRRDDYTQPRQK
jgi:hypothetical protein